MRDRLSAENLTARLQAPSTIRPTATEPWSLSPPPPPEPRLPLPPAGADSLGARFDRIRSRTTGIARLIPLPRPYPVASSGADGVGAPLSRLPPNLPSPGPNKIIQLYDAYLVMETEKGMLVIDQHALHERILFEQLKRRVASGNPGNATAADP